MTPLTRNQLAWRAAQDVREGMFVNLGIGLPTLVADHIPPDREVIFHSENGILGMGGAPAEGSEDPDLINAGKQFATLRAGGSFVSHNDAFLMIRGGHLHLSLMGAFEVSVTGDLANWNNRSAVLAPGVGGAMDLAAGAQRVAVLVEHTTRDGAPRLVERCSLPLTAPGCVSRIYTNLAVIDIAEGFFHVREMVAGLGVEELRACTGAPVRVAPDCKILSAPMLEAC